MGERLSFERGHPLCHLRGRTPLIFDFRQPSFEPLALGATLFQFTRTLFCNRLDEFGAKFPESFLQRRMVANLQLIEQLKTRFEF